MWFGWAHHPLRRVRPATGRPFVTLMATTDGSSRTIPNPGIDSVLGSSEIYGEVAPETQRVVAAGHVANATDPGEMLASRAALSSESLA